MLKKVNHQKTEVYSTRVLSLEYLEQHYRREWNFLLSHCLEPNFFYTPDFLMALRNHIMVGEKITVITCWRKTQNLAPEIIGIFPFLEHKFLWGRPVKMLQSLIHPYIAEATPLLHKDYGELAVINLLDHLEEQSRQHKAVNFSFLPEDTAFYALLSHELSFRERPLITLERYQRAALMPTKDPVAYLADMRKKRRKDIAKCTKKLAATGKIRHICMKAPHSLNEGLDWFLELEASGWKGKKGTALKCNPKTKAFALDAFRQSGDDIFCRYDFLAIDQTIIAASLTLIHGSTAWAYKSAYDESFRRFAPSLQADIELTKNLLSDPAIALTDSAALPGHIMEDYWQQHRTISNILFATNERVSPLYMRLLAQSYHGFTKARNEIKSLVQTMKHSVKSIKHSIKHKK